MEPMSRLTLIILAATAAATAAHAAPSCHGISVTSLAFGNYNVYSATPLDSAGTISYSCPPPAVPTVDMSAGGANSYSPRKMQRSAGGPDLLAYNIFVDAARTTVWISGVSVPSGNTLTVPFYGRIFPLQDVSVGAYTDTLVVTFNF
jgi:spore coat protein U-like protein